jgi:hypothetical protein
MLNSSRRNAKCEEGTAWAKDFIESTQAEAYQSCTRTGDYGPPNLPTENEERRQAGIALSSIIDAGGRIKKPAARKALRQGADAPASERPEPTPGREIRAEPAAASR